MRSKSLLRAGLNRIAYGRGPAPGSALGAWRQPRERVTVGGSGSQPPSSRRFLISAGVSLGVSGAITASPPPAPSRDGRRWHLDRLGALRRGRPARRSASRRARSSRRYAASSSRRWFRSSRGPIADLPQRPALTSNQRVDEYVVVGGVVGVMACAIVVMLLCRGRSPPSSTWSATGASGESLRLSQP